ncbi:hypothetical protein ACM66B_004979 [Microbotryomycetes sp. NB124-2]
MSATQCASPPEPSLLLQSALLSSSSPSTSRGPSVERHSPPAPDSLASTSPSSTSSSPRNHFRSLALYEAAQLDPDACFRCKGDGRGLQLEDAKVHEDVVSQANETGQSSLQDSADFLTSQTPSRIVASPALQSTTQASSSSSKLASTITTPRASSPLAPFPTAGAHDIVKAKLAHAVVTSQLRRGYSTPVTANVTYGEIPS